MTNKHYILVFSILVVTTVVVSACFSAETAPPAEEVPPTATPVSPTATSPPTETSAPVPTDTPEPTDEPPAEPTDTPAPTDTAEPTVTPKPTATPKPRPPKSEGPLDFVQPEWVYMWERQPDNNVKVVIEVVISGGAPPFTIKHDGFVDGKTWERLYLLDFLHLGCSGIGHTITVESADGQSVTHDYWLHVDRLDWCN